MRAGSAKIAAIGDTAAGVFADVLTAAALSVAAPMAAPEGATVVVAGAVCAAPAAAVSVCTELAGRAGSELLTTGAADAVCADEPVCGVGAEPRSAATLAPFWAAAVGINGAMGAKVAAVEVVAEPLPPDDAAASPAVADSEVVRGPAVELCPLAQFSVLDEIAGVLAGESALVAFAVGSPELCTNGDRSG